MGKQSAKQYLAVVVVNMYLLVYGIFNGWIATEFQFYFDRLQSDENFSWTEFETDSFRELCLFFIGPIVGSIFFGYIAIKFGRKTSLLYMPIPMIMSCLLNVFVHEFFTFKLSIVLGGIFGGSAATIGTLYLVEIASDRFRGVIVTSLFFSTCLGEMLAFTENLLLRNNIFALWSRIPLSAIVAVLFYFYLPDTPLSLIKRKKFVEAEESIRFYKNIRKTDINQLEALKQEVDRVKNAAVDDDLEANQMNPLQWADFKTKCARRALAIVMVLVVLNACGSNGKITIYSAMALTHYPTYMPLNGAKWVVSIVAVLGACASLLFVDRIGRKVLIKVSAVVTSLALFGYTLHMATIGSSHTETFKDSIPTITLLLAIFFGPLGIRSLTYTISTEIMPDRIKDIGVIFCGAFFWVFSFIFHATMYFVADGPIALISAIVCLVGAITIHFILPETKGKSHQEIMKLF